MQEEGKRKKAENVWKDIVCKTNGAEQRTQTGHFMRGSPPNYLRHSKNGKITPFSRRNTDESTPLLQ